MDAMDDGWTPIQYEDLANDAAEPEASPKPGTAPRGKKVREREPEPDEADEPNEPRPRRGGRKDDHEPGPGAMFPLQVGMPPWLVSSLEEVSSDQAMLAEHLNELDDKLGKSASTLDEALVTLTKAQATLSDVLADVSERQADLAEQIARQAQDHQQQMQSLIALMERLTGIIGSLGNVVTASRPAMPERD